MYHRTSRAFDLRWGELVTECASKIVGKAYPIARLVFRVDLVEEPVRSRAVGRVFALLPKRSGSGANFPISSSKEGNFCVAIDKTGHAPLEGR